MNASAGSLFEFYNPGSADDTLQGKDLVLNCHLNCFYKTFPTNNPMTTRERLHRSLCVDANDALKQGKSCLISFLFF